MSIFKRLQSIISAEIDSRFNSKGQGQSSGHYRSSYNHESEDNSKSSPYSTEEQQFYANLELQPGANFDEIRASYKRLLKKYHPDRYHNDERAEYAEEITQKLNEAYNYFEKKFKE